LQSQQRAVFIGRGIMRNIKGFTLVEVVITIIIITILSLVGTAAYRRHLDNAKYSEGLQLIQSIKEQQDLALSFASSTVISPFVYTNLITSTFTFNRDSENLGKFSIYPQNYKYFRSFEIREPNSDEKIEYNVEGFGYVVESYYPDKLNCQLLLKLVGSSEGPYTVVKDRK
jgi:prepilin-type N-terminal cleavage/methylation domain-containing protein